MTEVPDAAMLMSMVKNVGAGFTDSKWDELLSLVDDQAQAIQRVRELHTTDKYINDAETCMECDYTFPCNTIKALDGEQS